MGALDPVAKYDFDNHGFATTTLTNYRCTYVQDQEYLASLSNFGYAGTKVWYSTRGITPYSRLLAR